MWRWPLPWEFNAREFVVICFSYESDSGEGNYASVVSLFLWWQLPCWREQILLTWQSCLLVFCPSPLRCKSLVKTGTSIMNLVSTIIRKNGKSRSGMLRTLIAKRFSFSDTLFLFSSTTIPFHPILAHRRWREKTKRLSHALLSRIKSNEVLNRISYL